jgi:hypothetical protein
MGEQMKHIFSREQNATNAYNDAYLTFERFQLASGPVELVDFSTLVSEATGMFGRTELAIRQSDRYIAIGIREGTARELYRDGMELNRRGLDLLDRSRTALDRLRHCDDAAWKNPQLGGILETHRLNLMTEIAELEIRGSDVKQIDDAVAECISAAKKGPEGLASFLSEKIDRLDSVRREPDRGSRVNSVPVWKIIGIALFIGAWIWGAVSCGFFGCTVSSTVAPGVLAVIGAVLIAFC